MNSQYIKKLSLEELEERLKPFLTKYNLNELTKEQFDKMITITREPLTILSDITDAVEYFFGEDANIDEETQTKVLDTETSQTVLKDFVSQAEGWNFDEETLEKKLEEFRGVYKEKGVKPKVTMWAIRAAVTGRTRGADMCAVLSILGKENVLSRIKNSIK